MSSSSVTPRKRKVSNGNNSSPSTKANGRGLPTPNPPLLPFPTPPRSRHRSDKISQPEFKNDILTPPSTPSSKVVSTATTPLPPHLHTLLTLHHALNLALSLHIATHPPVLPPHSPSATSIPLPALTNLLAIKDTVERGSGRRFGPAELARLAWIWQWDGTSLPDEKLVSERSKRVDDDDDNPFLVKPPSDRPSTSQIQVGGLSYLITPTRTLDNGRRVYTYGIGLELDLKPGETRQVLFGGNEGGLGNKGQAGGTGAIARWNATGDVREAVFRRKLDKWVELNGGYEAPKHSDLPTPTSSSNVRSSIPPIPLLPLPHLPASTLLPAANLFSTPSSSLSSSPGLTSSPKKKSPQNTAGPSSGLADPFVLDDPADKGKIVRTGSVEERRQAMMDRLKARKAPTATLGSSVGGIGRLRMSAMEKQEELKRRSTLSRLEGVAEGVWMMFSGSTLGPSSLPTPPRGRRKAIPMTEVADVIVKSSKTPISIAEAQTSLTLLTELCPFFLTVKTIAKQEWLEMPSALATSACPPSPSSSLVLGPSSGSGSGVRDVPISSSPRNVDGANGLINRLPEPPSSPTPLSTPKLAGPASPGRVRRVGGLREVRERIRRELGE
ncbi:hypothetical protein BCR39DRAFT_515585 [Naematelia encephala]|uniref:DNA replication factor Cdt1 C-terminal domain-containing protein n=1 Tax=Naematelia encephala TaxID=71784 RepID=A0A1Y2BJG5_9TREE|nr:hypothetical protein BCR39DRAFT_515585 [Naematelia encephala]